MSHDKNKLLETVSESGSVLILTDFIKLFFFAGTYLLW